MQNRLYTDTRDQRADLLRDALLFRKQHEDGKVNILTLSGQHNNIITANVIARSIGIDREPILVGLIEMAQQFG